MPLEKREKAERCAGSLSACLVDGNAEQTATERKIKRRALAMSVSLQTIGLTALVIAPLLAKPAELAMRTVPPMPIYRAAPKPVTAVEPPHGPIQTYCETCFHNLPPIVHVIQATVDAPPGEVIPGLPQGPTSPDGAIPILMPDAHVPPPQADTSQMPRVVHVTHIDPAQLVRRVEPTYPALPKQLHRSGKVELHALIAKDGTVHSLEAVSGDPLFVRSALDAVWQWRYRPTMLNGQAVEVDTYITVVYTLHE